MPPWPGLIEAFRDRLPVTETHSRRHVARGEHAAGVAPRLSEELGLDVRLKVEGLNPTGSFKDRGMTIAISKAVESDAKVVICASTGNTSASGGRVRRAGRDHVWRGDPGRARSRSGSSHRR